MPATKNTTPVEPPAAAVAADAHWAAKMKRLRDRTLAETVFTICDDRDIAERRATAQYDLDRARDEAKAQPGDPDVAARLEAAASELEQAQAAYDQVAIPLRFRALPRLALEALYKAHKPSEEEATEGAEWGAGFPAALVSAASVDGMSETDAQDLLDTWSLAEANALFHAAHGVQQTTRADLGKG
ncbi:hypothetical protein ABZ829_27915 [Streptomyces xanthochromogenes]|uniref:hypothetical protein n=1 Tax=Streptomyces xanthochromogenes TaxID=67384 RepID=UPI00341E5B5D